jgi:2'-5' RNA ligase
MAEWASMRLFTGISIDPTVLTRIDNVIDRLRPLVRIRWSPPANFHITTKFIGEWPEDRLEVLKDALSGIGSTGRFSIRISRLGYMPSARHSKILFAGIDGGEALAGLARRTDQALQTLGCSPETRPYRPHLTLARMKSEEYRELRSHTANLKDMDFGSFEATSFHLYLSQPGASGSVYTELATWSLS